MRKYSDVRNNVDNGMIIFYEEFKHWVNLVLEMAF